MSSPVAGSEEDRRSGDTGRVDDEVAGQVRSLIERRIDDYVDVWDGASDRMRNGSYRSEHLLDDGFRLLGLMARDWTAAAALAYNAIDPDSAREGRAR